MKNLDNIEKSGFRRGEYVGYADGVVWLIRKDSCNFWKASPQAAGNRYSAKIVAVSMYSETLTELSAKLRDWRQCHVA
jgi:hypothetical protein